MRRVDEAAYGEVVCDLATILNALDGPRLTLHEALPDLPSRPGLYALYGDKITWADLDLEPPCPKQALYVGKAEDSLVARDLHCHFDDGRTGSSTLRRSVAALLREKLMLSAIPRNPSKPGHFANFGLGPGDDAKLTAWMRERLEIAVWVWDRSAPLRRIEGAVLQRLNPPLNLAGVRHSHRASLQAARKIMADQARAWRGSSASN